MLKTKKFGFRKNDREIVEELLTDLVKQFEENWEEEARLYKADVKANSIVSDWVDSDWEQCAKYIAIDLVVELVVFAGTVLVLKRIYPDFDAGRILRGLLRTHWVEFTIATVAVWTGNLYFQTVYAGMDMRMRFEWLDCYGKENSTWVSTFKWEC